jgi:Raf kinase inhibitor-like YbhB/YbcL family protein
MAFTLRSPAFTHQGEIPERYTCEGAEDVPALEWSGAPPGTKSFALVVDDPDAPDPKAPKRRFVHWVLYDLPASTQALPPGGAIPTGTRQGRNDGRSTGWTSPCPPIGRHRYVFKLYALDAELGDLGTPTGGQLEQAMEGRVLARAELVGTYEKKR